MNQNKFFEGLKVLEFSSVLAGPSVGMFFAELGATVYKIENINTEGDVTRKWKLPKENPENDISSYFSCANWGKHSIAINLEKEEGLKIIYELVAKCDIVLTSFRSGDDEKLKVDYKTLKNYNAKIIYGHVTGYGLNNDRAGFDAILQAETGFMYMNGEADAQPLKMPVALIDILAAHHLKEAILLALLNKERNNKGEFIEVSLFNAGISSLANQATNWLVAHEIPQKIGSEHPNIAPYGTTFKTADDKEIVLAVGTNKQFKELVSVLGIPEMATDKRFADNLNRVTNRNELNNILKDFIKLYRRNEILILLEEKKIPVGAVQNMKEVFETVEAKQMILNGKYEDGKSINGVNSIAFNFSENNRVENLMPPPHYGEHTTDILNKNLNYSEEKINDLIKKGVVYARKK